MNLTISSCCINLIGAVSAATSVVWTHCPAVLVCYKYVFSGGNGAHLLAYRSVLRVFSQEAMPGEIVAICSNQR